MHTRKLGRRPRRTGTQRGARKASGTQIRRWGTWQGSWVTNGPDGPEGLDGLLRHNGPFVADRYRRMSLTFKVRAGVTGDARAALSFSLFSLFSLFLIFCSLFLIFSSFSLIFSSLFLRFSFSFFFLSFLSAFCFSFFPSLFSRLWRFLASRSTSRDICASYSGAPRYASGGKLEEAERGA